MQSPSLKLQPQGTLLIWAVWGGGGDRERDRDTLKEKPKEKERVRHKEREGEQRCVAQLVKYNFN